LDFGPVLSGYVGLILFSAAAIAIGLMISSLTESQTVAFFITFVVLLLLQNQNHISWGAMLCHWVSSSKNVEGSECLLVPVDESSMIPQNGRQCSTAHPMPECHMETRILNNTA